MHDPFDDQPIEMLLAAVAEQDRAAFAALYRRTSPKLYGVLLRILIDRSETDDAMQDLFVRIWRGAGAYDASRGAPLTWLAAVARNLAIDLRRRGISRGSDRRSDTDPEMLSVAMGGASSESLATLNICLDRLDPANRALILAAYIHGDSREDLAERSGKPVGTIKSLLRRGLAALKACLDG
ncbi:sigma-70 family RNA polymerase sigma factor [Sphingomonas naphthae]|uniref:Sigma-70 family RNA polymerase sigma factor n=1 Tax=Sphingomonas naphthae TaxID=1813468 RepID=A0ABY7TLF2_9SPHN|nr:sigma-70 family RNA polymerase sigma factor [Sphingomonas naphthae]WCT74071.1 sigma-70 family RNA polymerase sigma factor [Sphingomonas naphthae]